MPRGKQRLLHSRLSPSIPLGEVSRESCSVSAHGELAVNSRVQPMDKNRQSTAQYTDKTKHQVRIVNTAKALALIEMPGLLCCLLSRD